MLTFRVGVLAWLNFLLTAGTEIADGIKPDIGSSGGTAGVAVASCVVERIEVDVSGGRQSRSGRTGLAFFGLQAVASYRVGHVYPV